MKQKKNNLLIILIIIGVILIISLSLIYFVTDIFKSDKKLFLKYSSKMINEEDGFFDSSLEQYYEKQQNSSYTNKGTIKAEFSGLEEFATQMESINNTQIEFSGKIDNANSKVAEDISINYSDSVKFPFSVKKVGNTFGMQTEHVGARYITTDMNEISNFNELNVLSSINLEEVINILTTEQLQKLKQGINSQVETLKEKLQDNKFSKAEENGTIAYKLNVTKKELSEQIQEIIDKLNISNISEDSNIEIAIYKKDGQISKISLKCEDINVTIEKTKTENVLQYNILFERIEEEQKKAQITAIIKYEGLESLQNIIEDYELAVETEVKTSENSQTLSCKYNINNTVNFEQTTIEDYTSENSLNLTSLEPEQRKGFISSVNQRIAERNNEQMAALGIQETQNPLIYMNPTSYINFALTGISENPFFTHISEMEEVEIATYNAKFELYEDSNLGGGTVKGLLTTIAQNNGYETDEDNEDNGNTTPNQNELIKEINLNGEEYEVNRQTLALIKEEIVTEDYYRVEFERDSTTGRIYRAVINKK